MIPSVSGFYILIHFVFVLMLLKLLLCSVSHVLLMTKWSSMTAAAVD